MSINLCDRVYRRVNSAAGNSLPTDLLRRVFEAVGSRGGPEAEARELLVTLTPFLGEGVRHSLQEALTRGCSAMPRNTRERGDHRGGNRPGHHHSGDFNFGGAIASCLDASLAFLPPPSLSWPGVDSSGAAQNWSLSYMPSVPAVSALDSFNPLCAPMSLSSLSWDQGFGASYGHENASCAWPSGGSASWDVTTMQWPLASSPSLVAPIAGADNQDQAGASVPSESLLLSTPKVEASSGLAISGDDAALSVRKMGAGISSATPATTAGRSSLGSPLEDEEQEEDDEAHAVVQQRLFSTSGEKDTDIHAEKDPARVETPLSALLEESSVQ